MDKETLSNYGWIVVLVLVLAVMLALATPFGNFIAGAFKATYAGFGMVGENALEIIIPDSIGEIPENKDPALNPVGVKSNYEQGDYRYYPIVESGNEFGAKTLEEAWEYVHTMLAEEGMTWQDFLDMYAQYGYTEEQLKEEFGLTENTFEPAVITGYEVSLNYNVTDRTKTSYGPILESINGIPIVSVNGLFYECENMIVSPKIPITVKDMGWTYIRCKSMTTAPIIPSGVTNIECLYSGCESLKTYVGSTDADGDLSNYALPQNIITMFDTFLDCKSITLAPTIPSSVVNLVQTFWGCSSLLYAPDIPENVTEMTYAFNQCTSLKAMPNMSNANNLTTIMGAFKNCSSMVEMTTIPNSVMYMNYTFWGCESIVDASSIIIPTGVEMLEQTFYGCTSLTTAPTIIPDNVLYLYSTFYNCKSLTGTITIYDYFQADRTTIPHETFTGTEKPIIIEGTLTDDVKQALINSAENGNVTCK